jgi:hypothetical protein
MDSDNGKRGSNAVVLSLYDLPNEKVRVYMDDVSNSNPSEKGPWQDRGLVTWKDCTWKELKEMDFSEEELAGLGAYVLARLQATKKHPVK